MKQKILFLLLSIYFLSCARASAQFYNSLKQLSSLETESAAIEMNNGFIFGFTETDNHTNFHENILLIKTTASGSITWSKRLDAGSGISLHLIEMIRTAGNEILISGITGPDNNFVSSTRCIVKLNAGGRLIWAKKYTPANAYDYRGLVQLKDSSFVFSLMASKIFAAVVRVNSAGTVLGAAKINNRTFESIHSITAIENTADIVIGNKNIVNINFKTGKPLGQRQYNTSNQFTALLSTRCRNGDIVYLAGRNSGGVLTGNSRIFRTAANGSLLWAKNIDAFVDSSRSLFSRFDIVSQVAVHEDVNGNIVAMVEAESTESLMIVLNAAGKYLYHRLFYVPYSFIKEINNGSYLHTAPAFNTSSGDAIMSNRFLSSFTSCDSTIFVKITTGTDSAATPDKLVFSTANITATDIPVTVKDTIVQTNAFCDLSRQDKNHNKKINMPVTFTPNPATTSIIVKTAEDLPFTIYSMTGTPKIKSTTNHPIDISGLEQGVYMINIISKDEVINKILVKR